MLRVAAIRAPWRRRAALAWIALLLLPVALAAGWHLLPLGDWLWNLRGSTLALGLRGVVAFALVYALGAVVLAPEAVLTVFAGFAYGAWGLPIVVVAATTGAALAFLLARHTARRRVLRLLAGRPGFAAIDRAIAAEGWKIVALLRLNPLVPFNLQNYLFGVTAIRFGHFIAATFAGIVPGAALYTYLGALGAAAPEATPAKGVLLVFGLAATLIVAVVIARKARRLLATAGVADQGR